MVPTFLDFFVGGGVSNYIQLIFTSPGSLLI